MRCLPCINTLSFHHAGCQNLPAAAPARQIPTLIFQPVTDSYTDRKVCSSSGLTSLSLSPSCCLSLSLFSFSLWIFRWSCKLVCSFHSSEETAPNIRKPRRRLDNQHHVVPDGRPQGAGGSAMLSEGAVFFDLLKLPSNTGKDAAGYYEWDWSPHFTQNSVRERHKMSHRWEDGEASRSVEKKVKDAPNWAKPHKMLVKHPLFQNWKENKSAKIKTFLPWRYLFTSMGHTMDCSFHGYLKDHILEKQVFTYRAQQGPNLTALGLYNKRHALCRKKKEEKREKCRRGCGA